MKARDLAIETFSALDANRGRTFLTVLGIVIGISAVIAMTALIGGINKALVGELGLSQAQVINIGMFPDGREVTYDDVDKMARDLTDYEFIVASSSGNADVSTGQKKKDAGISGCKPLYFKAMGKKILKGRIFTDAEEGKGALVVVLDQNSVRVLFGNADEDVVGKSLRIGNNDYTIVGVIESESYMNGVDMVELSMPFSTCSSRITGNKTVNQIKGFAREDADIDALVSKTEDYIAATYNFTEEQRTNNMYVSSMKSVIDSMNATMGAFSLLMTVVAGVSLLVGGIGIMNMMLTNVTERIREIGLRKALGARRSDITKQFMLESICICLLGGLLGVLFGYLGAYGLAGIGAEAVLGGTNMKVTPYVDLSTVLMATGICVFIGVLFGWYPARRASKLDPVESLHYQ